MCRILFNSGLHSVRTSISWLERRVLLNLDKFYGCVLFKFYIFLHGQSQPPKEDVAFACFCWYDIPTRSNKTNTTWVEYSQPTSMTWPPFWWYSSRVNGQPNYTVCDKAQPSDLSWPNPGHRQRHPGWRLNVFFSGWTARGRMGQTEAHRQRKEVPNPAGRGIRHGAHVAWFKEVSYYYLRKWFV